MSATPVGSRRAAAPSHAASREPGAFQSTLLLLCSGLPLVVATLPITLLPQMTADLGADAVPGVPLSVILVVPTVVIALLGPVAGYFIDSWGRIPMLVGALVLMAVAGMLPIWVTTPAAVLACSVVLGACSLVIIVVVPTLIGDRFRSRRRLRLLGLVTVVGTVAAAALPVLATLLSGFGWRAGFVLYGVGLPLAALIVLLVEERRGLTRAGARRLPPVSWGRLGPACVATLVSGALYFVVLVEFPRRLGELGVTDGPDVLRYTLLGGVCTVAGALAFGWLGHFGPARLLPVGFVVSGAGVVLVGAATTLPLVALGAAAASLSCGVVLPTVLTWAVASLNLEQRGRGAGWWASSGGVGSVLVGFLGPVLGGPLGGANGFIVLVGGIGLLMALAVVPLVRASGESSGSSAWTSARA